jgi:hypothetical protein
MMQHIEPLLCCYPQRIVVGYLLLILKTSQVV